MQESWRNTLFPDNRELWPQLSSSTSTDFEPSPAITFKLLHSLDLLGS
jgi:hypothetical protein